MKKHLQKTLSFFTALALVFSVSALRNLKETHAFSGSGAGTSGDPYIITTCSELQEMELDLAAYYELGNDIDCSATSSWNSGAGFSPVGTNGSAFTGSFNGNHYVISDLYINRPSKDYVALFGYTGSGSSISKIGLENVDITGSGWTGGLAGYTYDDVDNTYVTGIITANGLYSGGLIGESTAQISNSYSSVNIITNSDYVGGLTGWNSTGYTIKNSYAVGDVSGSGSYVGRLVGHDHGGTITNSYYWSGSTCTGCNQTYGTAEATLSNFYDKTHNVYDSNTPYWDFSTIWQENASDFPNFKAPLFVDYQSITNSNAYEAEGFTIGSDSYLFIGNQSGNSPLYKWNSGNDCFGDSGGTCGSAFQNLSAGHVYDAEVYTLGADTYLAATDYSGGNTSIYKWSDTNSCFGDSGGTCGNTFQSITGSNPDELTSFTIGADSYLGIANWGTTANIYKWSDANSCFGDSGGTCGNTFQTFTVSNGYSIEGFKIGTDVYLAVGAGSGSTSNLYKWSDANSCFGNSSGTCGSAFQSITTNQVVDIEPFVIGSDEYMAISNRGSSYANIYKWSDTNSCFGNSSGTCDNTFQSISASTVRDVEHFNINSDIYLAVANEGGTSYVYKWNGSTFDEAQSFTGSAPNAWGSFLIGNYIYLALANYSSDVNVYKATVESEIRPPVSSGEQDWSGEAATSVVIHGATGTTTMDTDAHTMIFNTSQTTDMSEGSESGVCSTAHDGTTVCTALDGLSGGTATGVMQTILANGTSGGTATTTLKTGTTEVILEDSTTLYADQDWDSSFIPPYDNTSGLTFTGKNIFSAVSLGLSDKPIVMDKAAKVILPTNYGSPYYKHGAGAWNQISACTDATTTSAGSLTFPNECYLYDSGNTIIWTYHFSDFGDAGSSGVVTIAAPTTITAPVMYGDDVSNDAYIDISTLGAGDEYFSVSDYKSADAGYYTTLSSTDLTAGGYTISASNVAVTLDSKSVVHIDGDVGAEPDILLSAGYSTLDTPRQIIGRSSSVSGVKGSFGVQPTFRVTIPAYQSLGTYSGTLTYTLTEN